MEARQAPLPGACRASLVAAAGDAAGVAGAASLGTSFALLPAPRPVTAPLATLARYAATHQPRLAGHALNGRHRPPLQVIFVLATASSRRELRQALPGLAEVAVPGLALPSGDGLGEGIAADGGAT